MITPRRSDDRGHFDFGWLETRHSFSFGDYFDAAQMGFRSLRVINEDVVRPGSGFPTHGHRDMEILTWVLEGALEHKDSLGTGSVIRPGEIQRMSAGTGVRHSEFNASKSADVHFLQIWIVPERAGIAPSYEQRGFDAAERTNALRLLASPDGRDGSVRVHQDARLYVATAESGREIRHALAPGRHAWVQVSRGRVQLGKLELAAGDGASISGEEELVLRAKEASEVLVFDLG
jgi:redox-sensitive bicupin YhaK (pirin superfamily)